MLRSSYANKSIYNLILLTSKLLQSLLSLNINYFGMQRWTNYTVIVLGNISHDDPGLQLFIEQVTENIATVVLTLGASIVVKANAEMSDMTLYL